MCQTAALWAKVACVGLCFCLAVVTSPWLGGGVSLGVSLRFTSSASNRRPRDRGAFLLVAQDDETFQAAKELLIEKRECGAVAVIDVGAKTEKELVDLYADFLSSGRKVRDVRERGLSELLQRIMLDIPNATDACIGLKSSAAAFAVGAAQKYLPEILGTEHHTVWVALQDGLSSSFSIGLDGLVKGWGDETFIDKACNARRMRPLAQQRPECRFVNANGDAQIWPSSHWALPCSIVELPVFRRALLWKHLAKSVVESPVLNPLVLAPVRKTTLRHSPKIHLGSTELVFNEDETFSDVDTRLPSQSTHPASHKTLVRELMELLQQERRALLGSKMPSPSADLQGVPDCPNRKTFVDAGTCFRKKRAWKGDMGFSPWSGPLHAVGSCLPSVLVAGVQKAGTGEFGLWLDEANGLRRQDGGSETHFFDCVGRGRGISRGPCTSFRDKRMFLSHNKGINAKRTGPTQFSWKEASSSVNNKHSPPPMDALWHLYASLGHLNRAQFDERRLIFDKSPAYFDLANPKDVSRLLPSAKLIFLLRDPVERLHSGYFQMCMGLHPKLQNCSEAGFEILVDKTLGGGETVLSRHLRMGYYHKWLSRWLKEFPDDQVLILFHTVFSTKPVATMYGVESFLYDTVGERMIVQRTGLSEKTTRTHSTFSPHKVDGTDYVTVSSISKAYEPSHVSKLEPTAKAYLLNHYLPHNKRLRELLLRSRCYFIAKDGSIVQGSFTSQLDQNETVEALLPEWLRDL